MGNGARGPGSGSIRAVSTVRLLLILALTLALSVSAEAQSSRRKKGKGKGKKPAITKPVPIQPEPEPEPAAPEATAIEPGSEMAPDPSASKLKEPEAPAATVTPAAPAKPAAANGTVVLAIARSANAQDSASQLQEELGRLLSQKPDVEVVDLASAFPPPPPPSLAEADALYDAGKDLYDNLDPEAAAGKFLAAIDAYEKHPVAFKPERLANAFIFLGASQLLNGDKEGAKLSFQRALAAHPKTQPDTGMFGADVQTAFTDAQQAFNAEAKATLTIDSKPSGATVTVRGEEVGVTPLKSVPVHAGRHPVIISLPGYVPYAAYPQVAPGKTAEVKSQLEPLPALGEVLSAAGRATTEKAFDSDRMPPDVGQIATKLGARYVVLAAVEKNKRDPAEAELQVWDVTNKSRLRGLEVELGSKDPDNSTVSAADRIHGFLTGTSMVARLDSSSSSKGGMPQIMKKPWFWAAVVGGAAVVTGGVLYATQDRRGGGWGSSGVPGLGF
jgi:TolA-binding protein